MTMQDKAITAAIADGRALKPPPGDNKNAMAQGVYIAQLFAAKGSCKCAACRALRMATDSMIAEIPSEE